MSIIDRIQTKTNILLGDILGGSTSAIIALPQVLAFGVATGLGAGAGLWGAVILSLIAGFLGAKTPLVYGITGPVAIVLGSIMASIHGSMNAIVIIMVMAGIFQMLISLTALPSIVKYVPYPVISGFMNGVGVVIILLQLPAIIGYPIKASPFMGVKTFINHLSSINNEALILGVLTLVIVFVIPKRWNKWVPSQILALIVCTVISIKYSMDVPRISSVSFYFPTVTFPFINFEKILEYIQYAITLGIILSVESMLTLLVANSLTKTQNNPKSMLAAQGIGNIACALTGTSVGSAATMRSVAGLKAGATTKFAVFMTPFILVLLLYKFSGFVASIPMTVLAGILIKVGYDIVDTKLLRVIKHAPKDDLYVLLLVFFLTVFYNLITAVGAGIILASLLYAKRVADKVEITHKSVYDKDIMKLEKQVEKDFKHKIRIAHINGQFFFGSATQIISQFDETLGTKYIILNYESNDILDISAIFALEDIIVRLKSQHIKILLVIKNKEIREQLKKHDIIKEIGSRHVFYDEIKAINYAKKSLKRGQ